MVLTVKQLFRLFDFGEMLRRIEVDEDWREQLGHRPSSASCPVQARQSNSAAQFKCLCLLASGDCERSLQGIFRTGNIRRVTTQQ